jgi:hypothetical protein
MNGWEELCLAAIGPNEDLVKQIDHAMKQAAKNCIDPNTEAKAKRVVRATITLLPAEDQRTATITYKVEAKLAGDKPGVDYAVFSQDGTASIPMADQLPLSGLGVVEDDEGRRHVVERGE